MDFESSFITEGFVAGGAENSLLAVGPDERAPEVGRWGPLSFGGVGGFTHVLLVLLLNV